MQIHYFFLEFLYKLHLLWKVGSFPAALRPSQWKNTSFVSGSWVARPSQTWFLQRIQPGQFFPSHFFSFLLTQHTPSADICSSPMLLDRSLWTSACGLEEKGIKLRSAKLAVVSSVRGWRLPKSQSLGGWRQDFLHG